MRSSFLAWILIGFSSIAPVVSGAAEEDPGRGAPRIAWREVADGLSCAEGSFFCDHLESPIQYEAIKVGLGCHRIAVLDARDMGEKTMSVREFVERSGAKAAINGGFFLEGFSPLGLIVSGGVKKNELRKADWGIFLIRRGKPELIHTREYVSDAAITEAIQVGPRLVIGGRVPVLKEQISRRSALGITRAGEVILLTTRSSASYADSLARFLARRAEDGGIDCVDALNLDGGPSTQLYADLPGFKIDTTGGYRVPNCIAVFSRTGPGGVGPEKPAGSVPVYAPEDIELLKKADELSDDEAARIASKAMELRRGQLIETGRSLLSSCRQVPIDSGSEGFLYSDLRGMDLERAGKKIEAFDGYFRELVKDWVPGDFNKEPAALFVFSKAKAYRRFAETVSPAEVSAGDSLAASPGFYHAATRITAVSAEGVAPGDVDYGILHEYAHHLFCRAMMASVGKTPPYWLDEGMALFAVSTFPRKAGKTGETGVRVGRLNESGGHIFINGGGLAKLKVLADETRRGAGLPLHTLFAATAPGKDDERARKRLARTAGFFLYFLFDSEPSLRDGLRAYIASGFEGAAFPGEAGDPLIQKKWERYIFSLGGDAL